VAVDAKSKTSILPFPARWRHGWAAAAACLVGWLLYAVWINHRSPAQSFKPGMSPEVLARADDQPQDNSLPQIPKTHLLASNGLDHSPSQLPVESRELVRLRRETTDLQDRIAQLSRTVAQQQAMLGESNRLKFFQLPQSSSNTGTAPATTLSPALQRAMFLAMARELGWLPSPDGSNPSPLVPFGPTNVDFVDLRPSTNAAPSVPQPQSNTAASPRAAPETSSPANAAAIAVPAFTSGNNMVVAIDQSIAPSGTQISFYSQDQQPLGSTVVGDNPVVVTVPMSLGGGGFFFTIGNGTVFWNTFQYFAPVTATP